MSFSKLFIRFAFKTWLLITFLFGSLLYLYGDLDDPDPGGALYFLFKDLFGILVGGLIIFVASQKKIPKITFSWAVFYLILFLYVASFILIGGDELGLNYYRVFKNNILYIGFSIIVLSCFLKLESEYYLIKVVLDSLFIALIISLLLFWFSPVQSYTGRLFGTFGSPNSAGFVSGFAIALALTSKNFIGKWRSMELLVIFISFLVMFFTASIGTILGILLFLYLVLIGRNLSFYRILISTIIFSLFISIVFFTFYMIFIQNATQVEIEIISRLISIAIQGEINDSIAIRFRDFLLSLTMSCQDYRALPVLLGCIPADDFVRFDSVIFSIIYNFGYIFGAIFLLLIFYPATYILLNRNSTRWSSKYKKIYPLIFFLISFVPINLILQHSFDLYPTNYLYAILLAILYNRRSKKYS